MGQHYQKLLAILALTLCISAVSSDARRVRYKTRTEDEDQDVRSQQVQYYAAQPRDEVETEPAGVVLISSDAYNGVYGRQSTRGQTDATPTPQYRGASSRALHAAPAAPRTRESSKQPPVQTIRNYSKVNDDGSFTFGYESADGTFKEETRGTDCVVRGKYGYVDPDGNKREFTYVSGNPCDPNAPPEEQQQEEPEDASGEENVPKGPLRPLRPTGRPTTVFQNDYNSRQQEDELDNEPQQLFTPSPTPARAQYDPSTNSLYQSYGSSATVQDSTPVYRTSPAIRITPRPPVVSSTVRTQLPATTYRPQLLAAVTPRPSTTVYGKSTTLYRPVSSTTASPYASQEVDFDEELRKFQLENNVVTTPSPRPSLVSQRIEPVRHAQLPIVRPQQQLDGQQPRKPTDPIYTSELVFDPQSGQYNTVLYQTLPQTQGADINLRARIQPYVHNPYYSQQATLLQQSPQVFAQQQQHLQQHQQQQQRAQGHRYEVATQAPASTRYQQAPQQFYYISPSAAGATQRENLSQGQISAFLRGHNINF